MKLSVDNAIVKASYILFNKKQVKPNTQGEFISVCLIKTALNCY